MAGRHPGLTFGSSPSRSSPPTACIGPPGERQKTESFSSVDSRGLEVERRGRGHVLDDLAENVEGGRVGGGGLALGDLDHDGHAIGQVVAESAAVAIDAGVLHDPAVGDDKSIGKIEARWSSSHPGPWSGSCGRPTTFRTRPPSCRPSGPWPGRWPAVDPDSCWAGGRGRPGPLQSAPPRSRERETEEEQELCLRR